MKNFSQLSLFFFAAISVGQAVAADFPLVNRGFVALGSPGLGKRQGSSGYYCEAGSYQCADGLGCCETGTLCKPGTVQCLKPCGAGSTDCYGSCCDAGYACVGKDVPCLKMDTVPGPTTTPVPTTYKSMTPDVTPSSYSTTMPKPTTPVTTPVKSYPTMPVGSTYSMPKPEPTYGGSSPNSTYPSKNATVSVIPLSGGNNLKPAGLLGGFGIVLFLAFFQM